eukprot:17242-Heterococcus_DN1.PRE.7
MSTCCRGCSVDGVYCAYRIVLQYGLWQLVQLLIRVTNISSLLTPNSYKPSPTTLAIIQQFSAIRGAIPSCGSEHPGEAQITVTFQPLHPCNYYRRYFVLLEQQLPLLLDCIGTGHVHAKGDCKEQRPAPLRHAHIQAFRNRCDVGLGLLSSDELDKMIETGAMSNDLIAGTGIIGTAPLQCPPKTGAFNSSQQQQPITRSGEAHRTRTCVARELFMPQSLSEIVLKTHNTGSSSSSSGSSSGGMLEFGHVSCGSEQYRTFELTNRTSGKVCVLFPSNSNSSNAAFTVTPAVTDISGGDSAVFTVQFTPTATDSYYLQEIEACVFFKNQRTFR